MVWDVKICGRIGAKICDWVEHVMKKCRKKEERTFFHPVWHRQKHSLSVSCAEVSHSYPPNWKPRFFGSTVRSDVHHLHFPAAACQHIWHVWKSLILDSNSSLVQWVWTVFVFFISCKECYQRWKQKKAKKNKSTSESQIGNQSTHIQFNLIQFNSIQTLFQTLKRFHRNEKKEQ